MKADVIVVGGGAGGCFSAIRLAELHPGARIVILEAGRKPLSKVEISGGGRCNFTHACYEPATLIAHYPRGGRELLGPFHHFQPADMVLWLREHGVEVKAESDGRMFPQSDSSRSIIDCFLRVIDKAGVQLLTSTRAVDWSYDADQKAWRVELMNGTVLKSDYLLVASGSDTRTWEHLKTLGHNIVPAVPSLFTFHIRDQALTALMGVSKENVVAYIPTLKLEAEGPVLITHWGLSGPAILKLSAWGARLLYECNYVFDIVISWCGDIEMSEVVGQLKRQTILQAKKQLPNVPLPGFSSRLWKYICHRASIPPDLICAGLTSKQLDQLAATLTKDIYRVTGKSTFKEEFVTAGGVDLKDVDMRRFESKRMPGLFLVGEVLNIDAVTGGFNFQAAWTGAELVARALAGNLQSAS